MFNSLSDSLESTFKKLRGQGKISEKNISDALREIRLALLEADVEFSVAKAFIAAVKKQAVGEKVLKSIKPGEQIVKIFHDELTVLLGGEAYRPDPDAKDTDLLDPAILEERQRNHALNLNPPAHIMMVGLNGAGKTTTSAKLANKLKKQGRRPLLIACDLYRPAAIDQLAKLGEQIDVPVYTPDASETDLVKVAKDALKWAKDQSGTALIFDTAGRQEIDEKLISELVKLHKFVEPNETLLVADAATGQQAVSVAQHFDEAVEITGIVLTKLDGDARGGAALSMRAVTGKPIKFIGEGEKIDDFSEFYPERLAGRILDMGDVVSMVENMAEKISEKDAMNAAKRMQSGKFDFNDFLNQMNMLKKLGPLDGILGMLPGMKKLKKQLPTDLLGGKKMAHMEAIVLSMTPKERQRPEIIKGTRRKRIAKGSGTSIVEVNRLLKQFGEMRKMFSGKGGKMKKMMQQMGNMEGMEGMSDLMKGLGSKGGKPPRRIF